MADFLGHRWCRAVTAIFMGLPLWVGRTGRAQFSGLAHRESTQYFTPSILPPAVIQMQGLSKVSMGAFMGQLLLRDRTVRVRSFGSVQQESIRCFTLLM